MAAMAARQGMAVQRVTVAPQAQAAKPAKVAMAVEPAKVAMAEQVAIPATEVEQVRAVEILPIRADAAVAWWTVRSVERAAGFGLA